MFKEEQFAQINQEVEQKRTKTENQVKSDSNKKTGKYFELKNEVVADTPSHNSSTYAVKFYLKDIE